MPSIATIPPASTSDSLAAPPGTGKLGALAFDARRGDSAPRAPQSFRPAPAPRKLTLSLVDTGSALRPGAMHPRAGTPDSGVTGSVTSSSYPDDIDSFGDSPDPACPKHLSPFDDSDEGTETEREERRVWADRAQRGSVPIPRATRRTSRRRTDIGPLQNTPAGTLRGTPAITPARPVSMPAADIATGRAPRDGGAPDRDARVALPQTAPDNGANADTAATGMPAGERIYHVLDHDGLHAHPTPPDTPIPAAPMRQLPHDGTGQAVAWPPAAADVAAHDAPHSADAPAVPTGAERHPDVRCALSALQDALEKAATHCALSPDKAARPAGDTRLRAIARARSGSDNPLGDRSLAFYKTLAPRGASASANDRHVAVALAALAQRAAGEGYDAVATQLVRRTLAPLLHSLPLETLCDVARLADRDDGRREAILLKVANLLGANKRRRTRKVEQAERELDVASALLCVVGELCNEHARAMSWDRPIAVALQAARNGHHEQLDAALRDLWRGDLLTGDMERPRVNRLMDAIGRLAMDERYALARMLGLTGDADATARNFAQFEAHHLAGLEYDPAVCRQVARFIDQLRVAAHAMLPPDLRDSLAGLPGGHDGPAPDAYAYPDAFRPGRTVGGTLGRLRDWLGATLRRRPKARDAAKAQVKQAILTLVDGGQLTAAHLDTLQSVHRRLNGKLGHIKGASLHRMLIQDRLSKLDPVQLARLGTNLAAARGALPASAANDGQDTIAAFLEDVSDAYGREAGVRRGAAALTQVMDALPRTRQPVRLLDALDALADAHTYALDRQSEQDFYEDVLRRLGPGARKTLHKRLNGRGGAARYMRGIDTLVWHAPAAWSQFRRHQLDMVSRAVRL